MLQYHDFFPGGSLIQVRHVQSAVGPSVEDGTDVDEVESYLKEYFGGDDEWYEFDEVCLVTKGNETLGWLPLLEVINAFASGDPVGPGVNPIELRQVISSDTPLFFAAGVLRTRDTRSLWVLEGNRITGRFSYRDLFKLPGVLCLFALTIELEKAALDPSSTARFSM